MLAYRDFPIVRAVQQPFVPEVAVIGGGLAGCEAAWQLAERGHKVDLIEMKPVRMSPAHTTPLLGELVCSNSLRSDDPQTPAGLLKAELRAARSPMPCGKGWNPRRAAVRQRQKPMPPRRAHGRLGSRRIPNSVLR